MQSAGVRYFVRVGGDVRGPVDEATVAGWIAAGMHHADVCVEGAQFYVPLAQTPLARHLPGGNKHAFAKWGGIGTGILLVLMMGLGRGARGCNRELAAEKKSIEASLPAVGSVGTLRGEDATKLCPQGKYMWGWPCGGNAIAVKAGSRVQIMKTGVHQMKGLCRYWVQSETAGEDVAGDAPCAWYRPD